MIVKVKAKHDFDQLENMAFYEFLDRACRAETNLRIKLNLLLIRRILYVEKVKLGEADHQFLLAYLEGAMMDVSV